MRSRLREEDKWVLLQGFKAGQAYQPKSAGAKLGPEWVKGWRAAQALRKGKPKPPVAARGKR